MSDTLPRYPANFERLLNEEKGPYFLGQKLTFADFIAFDLIDVHLLALPDQEQFWIKYPKLFKLYKAVGSRPNVSTYVNSLTRRKNDFKK